MDHPDLFGLSPHQPARPQNPMRSHAPPQHPQYPLGLFPCPPWAQHPCPLLRQSLPPGSCWWLGHRSHPPSHSVQSCHHGLKGMHTHSIGNTCAIRSQQRCQEISICSPTPNFLSPPLGLQAQVGCVFDLKPKRKHFPCINPMCLQESLTWRAFLPCTLASSASSACFWVWQACCARCEAWHGRCPPSCYACCACLGLGWSRGNG